VSYNIFVEKARNNTLYVNNNSDINEINKTSAELYSNYKGKTKAYQDSAGIFDGIAYRTLVSGRKGKYPYAWLHTTDGIYLAISNTELQKLRCNRTCQINTKYKL
jgi:hypothetical protein